MLVSIATALVLTLATSPNVAPVEDVAVSIETFKLCLQEYPDWCLHWDFKGDKQVPAGDPPEKYAGIKLGKQNSATRISWDRERERVDVQVHALMGFKMNGGQVLSETRSKNFHDDLEHWIHAGYRLWLKGEVDNSEPTLEARPTAELFCLDNTDGILRTGNPLQMWQCVGNKNQKWIPQDVLNEQKAEF